MNNYISSVIKKIEYLFWYEVISSVIFVHDEEDNERLDQVLFLEKTNGNVVGLYVNSMNPIFALNRFYDFDYFNLFASYDELYELKENNFCEFKVEYIKLVFNSQYNELCALFLSNADKTNSILLLFMHDEIRLILNCSKFEFRRILNESFLHVSNEHFLTYKKDIINNQWVIE